MKFLQIYFHISGGEKSDCEGEVQELIGSFSSRHVKKEHFFFSRVENKSFMKYFALSL